MIKLGMALTIKRFFPSRLEGKDDTLIDGHYYYRHNNRN